MKLLVNGKYPPPFSIRTTFKTWPHANPQMRDLIVQISRNVYGRDRVLVEEEIKRKMNPTHQGQQGNNQMPGSYNQQKPMFGY